MIHLSEVKNQLVSEDFPIEYIDPDLIDEVRLARTFVAFEKQIAHSYVVGELLDEFVHLLLYSQRVVTSQAFDHVPSDHILFIVGLRFGYLKLLGRVISLGKNMKLLALFGVSLHDTLFDF